MVGEGESQGEFRGVDESRAQAERLHHGQVVWKLLWEQQGSQAEEGDACRRQSPRVSQRALRQEPGTQQKPWWNPETPKEEPQAQELCSGAALRPFFSYT